MFVKSVYDIQRIYRYSIDQNLKVDMGSRAPSGIAGKGDLLALGYPISRFYKYLGKMSVPGLFSALMIDIDHIAVAATPAGPLHNAAAGSHNRGSHRSSPVNSLMIGGSSLLGRLSLAEG